MVERGSKKIKVGRVLSNKMDKTAVVEVVRTAIHPLYKKVVRRKSKFFAHDDKNACQVGDKVKIVECRPLSKKKCWRVVEIIEKSTLDNVQPAETVQI